jgi:hypothetical protein
MWDTVNEHLAFWKVSCQWVQKPLNIKINKQTAISLKYILQYMEAFDEVPADTDTGYETWAHHYCLES